MSHTCSSCSNNCELPSITNPSPRNLAVEKDGKILCLGCADVLDWADTFTINTSKKPLEKPKIKSESIQSPAQVPKQSASVTYLLCCKCQIQFSGPKCKCGYKNPMYR